MTTKTQNGIYTIDGRTYQVTNKIRRGLRCASWFVLNGNTWEWTIRPAGWMSAERMPAEDAKRYGTLTSTCICCGRKLTGAASVAAGIGPECDLRLAKAIA